jgi:hypothetical protein
MKYVFLMIGVLAASVLWGQKGIEKDAVQRQMAEVPGYKIMPD